MNYVGISKLCKVHDKSRSFMTAILCRPEFGQYRKDNKDGYFKFKNDINLHKQIKFIIDLKNNTKGRTCRFAY